MNLSLLASPRVVTGTLSSKTSSSLTEAALLETFWIREAVSATSILGSNSFKVLLNCPREEIK